MRSIVSILSMLVACGGPPEPPATPAAPPPTLANLAWLEGMWRSPALDERWLHVGGALYGVALSDAGYEINLIDDNDDEGKAVPITLTAYTADRDPATFPLVTATDTRVEFVAGPRVVRFTKVEHGLHGEYLAPPATPVEFALAGNVMAPAPELEAADRDFAIATATDGAAAWAHYYSADGSIWRGRRIIGPDAVRDVIAKSLDKHVLAWRPVASGKRGAWGFTLGTYEYGPQRGPAQSHGGYCTIWRQSDDGWKIMFDVGHPAGDD